MSHEHDDCPQRLEKKPGFETTLDHTAKVLIESILNTLIMQSEDQIRRTPNVNADEYVYASPHAYIVRKAEGRPKRGMKLMARIKHSCSLCQENAGQQEQSNMYVDLNQNTNMGHGDRHLATGMDENGSHLESISYDASSADKSSEIIEAANTLSKWAIETSQKELRAALENQMKKISKGTKDKLEQELTKTGKLRGILKKRTTDADRRERRCENAEFDSYGAESRRLVQLVIDTVLKDMESEFRERELSEVEKSVGGYESVVAAKALWLSEEVMDQAVSEIQAELAGLEDKISRREQSSPVDEVLLSQEIGDIVSRSISNAIQDRESKEVNLVITDLEEEDGETRPESVAVDESASCLAKQAICESVEDITDDVRNSSIQDVHTESRNVDYYAEMNHGGGAGASRFAFRPDVNVDNVDRGLGVSTNHSDMNSDGTLPVYSSTKYITLQRPDENIPEASGSLVDDRMTSNQYIKMAGDHKNLFKKKYPSIIRPLESLETIASVDESQEYMTPTRDTNFIYGNSSVSRNASNRMLNDRSVEGINITTNHNEEWDENPPPPLRRRNSSVMSRNNNTYIEEGNRMTDEYNRPATTSNTVARPNENQTSLSPRRNPTGTFRRNGANTGVDNGMSEAQVQRVDSNKYAVEANENLPPPPPPPPPVESNNAVVNEHAERPVESRYVWKPQGNVPPPSPVRNISVISGKHNSGSSRRMMAENEQMEVSPGNVHTTNYRVESYDDLPPPPPPITENVVDQYPQAKRNGIAEYNWQSGGNGTPVRSVVQRQQSPIYRNRVVNGHGQMFSPAEDTDTGGYAGDTEESVGRFGESQNVSFDETSDDEAGQMTRFRGNASQAGVLQQTGPKYLSPAGQMMSTKQRVTLKRNHRRIIKQYNTECMPSDDEDIITSAHYSGAMVNEPVCSPDERTYMGDRVYGFQESQQTGYTSYSPGIKSMGSSQHISFAKRRESIMRQYKPGSRPRYADYMYELPESHPSKYCPRIQNGILINNQDMIQREYEPDYNIIKDAKARHHVGEIIESCEEWQRPAIKFEEPRTTQIDHQVSCYSETPNTSSRTDKRIMFKHDSSCPPINNRLMETERTSSRNQLNQRDTDECIETSFPVEEYIQHFEEPQRQKGRYVDEGIHLFEQSGRMQLSPKSSVQKSCALATEGRRAKSRDDVSVQEPSGYVNENIHHFEDMQYQSPCAKPRPVNTQPKYASPNRDTCMAPRKMQQYENETEECTETGFPVEEYIQYFEEPNRPKGRYVDEGIQMFEQSRSIKLSPKSSGNFEQVGKPCALPIEGRRAKSTDDVSIVEPSGYVNENIHHFENMQYHSPCVKPRSANTQPNYSPPNRDTCMAPRKMQQYQNDTEECTETGFPVEEYIQYFEEPNGPKGRYVDEGIKMFEQSRSMQLDSTSNSHFGRVQKQCGPLMRDTSHESRDDCSIMEPICNLKENVQHFENLQRQALGCTSPSRKARSPEVCSSPTRHPCVASGRNQQVHVAAGECPEVGYTAAEDRYPSPCIRRTRSVERRSRCFPPSRTSEECLQVSVCHSPRRSNERMPVCSSPNRNTCMTPRQSDECIESWIPVRDNIEYFEESPRPIRKRVGEGIRSFENMQRVRIRPGSVSHFEGFQKPSRLAADDCCVGENVHCFEGYPPCRETGRRCSPPVRDTGVIERDSEECNEASIPFCENIQHFEGLQRQALRCPRYKETGQRGSPPSRNTCMMPRNPENCVQQPLTRFSPCRPNEARSVCSPPNRNTCMTPRQSDECIESWIPVRENIQYFEESPRPIRKHVGEGKRGFENLQRGKFCPGSLSHFEGFQKSSRLAAADGCVDENIQHFEHLQKQALGCPSSRVRPRSLETRPKCSSPSRNMYTTSRQPEYCTETISPVGENVRHFQDQRQRTKRVFEGIRDFETVQRTALNPGSDCYFERSYTPNGIAERNQCVVSKNEAEIAVPSNCYNENLYSFEDLRGPSRCVRPKSFETRPKCPAPRRNQQYTTVDRECVETSRPVGEYVQHFENSQRSRCTPVWEGIHNAQRPQFSPQYGSRYENANCVISNDNTTAKAPMCTYNENMYDAEGVQRGGYRYGCPRTIERPAAASRCSNPNRDPQFISGSPEECITRSPATELRCSNADRDSNIISGTPGECMTRRTATELRYSNPERNSNVISGTPGECMTRRPASELRCPNPDRDSNVISGTHGECMTRRTAAELRYSNPDRDPNVISGTSGECMTRRTAAESRYCRPGRHSDVIPGSPEECITKRRASESRRPDPDRDYSILSGTPGECMTRRHATQSKCPNPDRDRRPPEAVDECIDHTERTQRSRRPEAGERNDIDSQRTTSRSCSPRISSRSYESDSRYSYPNRGTSMISRTQSPTSIVTRECSVQYEPPMGEENFKRSKSNPQSSRQSKGSQRSNMSSVDDSIITRDEPIIESPSSTVIENIRQFEGSQRSNRSSPKNGSIITAENTTTASPTIRYDSLEEAYQNKTKPAVFDHDRNYPHDEIRSLVYTLMSYYERDRPRERSEERRRTDEDERRRVSRRHDVNVRRRDATNDRPALDDERCRVKCEHAIDELLLMQKLLAESQTGLSQTERMFQKILDAALCERFSAIAKKAMVTTVLDTNLEDRIKCGLLVLNITYALQLNISEGSLNSEAIARDTKRFVKEILNGIVGREARDILRLKGDILNGFKIEMDLGEVQLKGQECSVLED